MRLFPPNEPVPDTEGENGVWHRFPSNPSALPDQPSSPEPAPDTEDGVWHPDENGVWRSEPADLVIISACTVTSKAEQKARRIIRAALNENPASCVIVTGCYAQLNRAEIEALGEGSGRLFVVPNDQNSRLLDLPAYIAAEAQQSASGIAQSKTAPAQVDQDAQSEQADRDAQADQAEQATSLSGLVARFLQGAMPSSSTEASAEGSSGANALSSASPFRFDAQDFSFHSRPFLKIQDGCNNACTYCRVRLARGRSVSLAAADVLSRLRKLEQQGFSEAVLSGVNICQYHDASGFDLSDLLRCLIRGTEHIALRLTSLEPDFITEKFLAVLQSPRIQPHFHLSVQSGSAQIIQKMGRRYTAQTVLKAIERLRQIKNDPFLACDIITGFPGETEADFEQTYSLCEDADFAWIHAFPFSRRPGTAAFDFDKRVSEQISVKRVQKLTLLADTSKKRYIVRWIDKEMSAICLKKTAQNGFFEALSDNYLRLSIRACKKSVGKKNTENLPQKGKVFRCRISALNTMANTRIDALGELVTDPRTS
jgi:threonylcarbamoyladenosine tRNA methylthiotransferase MtaB